MPRGFSGNGVARRPSPRLFSVPHLPEKQSCTPETQGEESLDSNGVEELAGWVDRLLETDAASLVFEAGGSPAPSPGSAARSEIALPPALLLDAHDQADVWGAIDPTMPVKGLKPPCILSGPGAAVDTGIAVRPATAPAPEEENEGPCEFRWHEIPVCLVTEDGCGVQVEQRPLPAVGLNEFNAEVHLNPPLLFWAVRRKWMWHRKWMLPAISVDIRCTNPQPLGGLRIRALYVHVTAGTLRDDVGGLHDQGLVGDCQRRIELDPNGQGSAHFSHLLFKHTSFNCGARSFHLVVTLLADGDSSPAEAAAGAPPINPADFAMTVRQRPVSAMSMESEGMEIDSNIRPLDGPPATPETATPVSAAPDDATPDDAAPEATPDVADMTDASDMTDVSDTNEPNEPQPPAAAPANLPPVPEDEAAATAASTAPRIPLLCVRSDPIHVDARMRSKGERQDAASDDVRLVQRTQAAQNTLRQQAKANEEQASRQQQQAHAKRQGRPTPHLAHPMLHGSPAAQMSPHSPHPHNQHPHDAPTGVPWNGVPAGHPGLAGWLGRMMGGWGGEQRQPQPQSQPPRHMSSTGSHLPPANTGTGGMTGGAPAGSAPSGGGQAGGGQAGGASPGGGSQAGGSPAGGGDLASPGGGGAAQWSGTASDAVFEILADSTVVNVLSAGAFGYNPRVLIGQPFLAISQPDERQGLAHAIQVLLRMDEITRMSSPNGAATGPRQAIRVVHHVVMGLGQARRVELVACDSLITVTEGTGSAAPNSPNSPNSPNASNASSTPKLLVRSRQAGPNVAGPFRMLPVAS